MNEFDVLFFLSSSLCLAASIPLFQAVAGKAPKYGKVTSSSKITVNARLGWMIQEIPSFVVPLYVLWTSGIEALGLTNRFLVVLFMLHYFYRSLIYPLLMNTTATPVPLQIVIMGFLFTGVNGFVITKYEISFGKLSDEWLLSKQCFIGLLLWAFGLLVNVHSDSILRSLRKPNESGHKIPRGGMFEYVSAANYFGEIVEWIGLAIASNFHFPLVAFALSTTMGIGSRGVIYHKFYLKKFEDYPKNRKAVIPFIL